MLEYDLGYDVDILKLDIPQGATPKTPIVLTRQSRQRYYVPTPSHREKLSDRGPIGYKISYQPEDLEEGSDLQILLVEKKVSLTPLSIDQTSRADIQRLQSLLNED